MNEKNEKKKERDREKSEGLEGEQNFHEEKRVKRALISSVSLKSTPVRLLTEEHSPVSVCRHE